MLKHLEQQYLKAYQDYSRALAIEEHESHSNISGISLNKDYGSFIEFIAGLSVDNDLLDLSLIHISEPTRPY